MFDPKVSPAEIVLRVTLIYLFLLIATRFFGKKELSRLTPMEFLAVLLLARAVGPAMTANDNSLLVAFVAASTLLAITFLLEWLVFKSRRLERLIQGQPTTIIENGKIDERMLRRERMTLEQLASALREENVERPEDVRKAMVEPSGRITVIKNE